MKNEMEIDGKTYVLKSTVKGKRECIDTDEYVIVRTYSAGVFAGYLRSRDGKEVVLRDARRLWYWKGSASLSQMAQTGTSKPDECKFPCAVDEVVLTEAIEILATTEIARISIEGVPIWTIK